MSTYPRYESRTCPLCRGRGVNAVFRVADTVDTCERCKGSGLASVLVVDPLWQPPDPARVQKERDDLARDEGWWPTLGRVVSKVTGWFDAGGFQW